MKKYLFLLLVPFTFAQTEMLINYGEMFDYGIFVNDSLTNTVKSKELTLKYQYDFITISLKDTGTTYDDSISVEFTNPDQTAWYPVQFIKDSTFSNVTLPLVDDNSQHSYMIYVGAYYKIRIRMVNVQSVANRVHYFTLQAAKKNRQF